MKSLFTVSGEVVKHKERGRKIGFPTANIKPKDFPQDGIYLGYTVKGNAKLPSLIYVGAADTFGDTERFVESHILDFNGELYGETITLEALQRVRDGRKFEDVNEMLKQMGEDEKIARAFFEAL